MLQSRPNREGSWLLDTELLEIRSVTKTFRLRDGSVLNAVNGASLTVRPAETVALVGETGSGKSTLGRIALWLSLPDTGQVLYKGQPLMAMSTRARRTLRLSVQPIFQDPGASFNPRRRVRDLIGQAFRQKGLTRAAIPAATVTVLRSVGLPIDTGFLQRYPHQLSGGQRQRLAIARALAMEPELLIADEPLSGADASIRGQILNLLTDLQDQRSIAILFITHDISIARAFAHRVAVMYRGTIVEEGPADQVLSEPRHPYTQMLLAAVPSVEGAVDFSQFNTLARREVSAHGCVFYSRCPLAIDRCNAAPPALTSVSGNGHRAACFVTACAPEATEAQTLGRPPAPAAVSE
jgi:oligopeptide/dipeptide ABC transporter ATP-binding protein